MRMLSQRYQNLRSNEKAAFLYYKYVWNRIRKLQYNWAEVTTGDPGSGKTIRAIISAFILNRKRFDERFYCNTAKQFIHAVDDSHTGDTIVWDECGVSLSSRRWHSLTNILTGETLQTYRINKLAVFFVVPDLSFVDVQARKLMNAFIETKRYDLKRTYNWTYKISVDRKTGDVYFPYFQGIIDNRLHKIQTVIIPRRVIDIIPKKLLDNIKEKEIQFKKKLRKKNLKIIETIESEMIYAERTVYDMINEVVGDRNKFLNEKGKLDFYLIQTHFGIGKDKAIQVKKFIEKKASLSQGV